MELRGQLKSWNDQKGFGFIRPEQDREEVFAHISAIRGARRPVQGDRVLYLCERAKDGRLRATHIRLDAGLSIDEPAIRRKPLKATGRSGESVRPVARERRSQVIRQPLLKSLWFLLLCLLPAIGCIRLAAQGIHWPLFAYGLGSLAAFAFYLHDKQSALRSGWRTPEARLHLIEALGGWPGAYVAQQLLRHKTRKLSFQVLFWLIVVAHQVVWLDYLYLQRLQRFLLQL